MRGTGKRVSEIIDTFGQTQIEMTANSRKGSSVIGSIANTDSITKLDELDNIRLGGKDKHIQRAKKLTFIQMKAPFSSYFDDAQELHKIKNTIRGEHDISDSHIFRLVKKC